MANLIQTVPLEDTAHLSPTRLGRWTGLLLSFLTAAAFGIGMMSPPRSGSFCTDPCIAYPYSDATQFVPHDFIWMAPGIPLVPLFVVLAGCIHACSENGKRHLTLICLSFVSISAAILTLDYAIAIAVVQPSLLHAETEGVAIFSQYNPHGIFIVLEELGYLVLSIGFMFAGLAFPLARGLSAALRCTFLASPLLSFISLVALAWRFDLNLDYRLEIAVITINWTVLIVSGILLSIYFRRQIPRRKDR
jgi:hypothetical protein